MNKDVSPKFELSTLPRGCSNDDIFNEIKRVDIIVGKKYLTIADFDKYSKIHSSTIRHRFGGWQSVLEKAGIGGKYCGIRITEKMRQQSKRLSDEQILCELRRIATNLGQDYITQENIDTSSEIISSSTVVYRFGSWSEGLKRAGLEDSPGYNRRFSEDELFENILKVWTHYGRQPFYREIKKEPSTISPKTYESRFGSWRKALEAFVLKMNQENNEIKLISKQEHTETGIILKTKLQTVSSEDRRDIPLGLRYKVLKRDNFRCVRCGRSPATTLGLELEIDHKLPYSDGGKTVLENLETKCSDCNIGKGNRFSE
jgi:hypothetical protein